MRAGFRLILAIACALAALLALASAGAAQTPSADVQQGPLVLAPVNDRIVFQPDVSVTKVDNKTSGLAGFTAGKRFEDRLLLGVGGYVLVDDHRRDRGLHKDLFYAGIVAGYRVLGTNRLGLEARVLAGLGSGTVVRTVQVYARPDFRSPATDPVLLTETVGYRDDFLVAEPKIVFNIGLTDHVRVNLGAGYRATSANRVVNDAFNGATGTIGVEFDLRH